MSPAEYVAHLDEVLSEAASVRAEAMTHLPTEYQDKIREMRRDRED